MKYECDVIEDLLPLYKDGACSTATNKAVEEHLMECEKCKKMLDRLNDISVDELIVKEKENVIGSQSEYFKRKSALAGCVIAGIFALPILVCLIVNLVTGHGLTWFFIVLAAMLVPTSLFVIPLIAPKNKMLQTMVSLTASILILLAVCCIYTKGNWFFVAASAVLFGLTLLFGPFIACRRPVNAYLGNRKGLAVMAAATVTFYLMMICIGIHAALPGYFRLMLGISIPLVLLVWLMFFVIRYLPSNGVAKTGVCLALLSAFSYFGSEVILYLTIESVSNDGVAVYSRPSLGTALVGVGIGAFIALIGFVIGRKGGKEE
jgi:hypothetical protein